MTGLDANVTGSALTENLDKLFDLTSDVLLHPSFPDEELAKYKTRTKTTLNQNRSIPGFLGQELYNKLCHDLPAAARKFIFATGDSGAPDVVDFLATIDVPVLEKPFELRSLEQIAQQVRAEGVARGENN